MTLPIGSTLLIGSNPVHPRLAGQLGTVVQVTPVLKRCGSNGSYRRTSCGGNPILEVEGVGRVLVPKEAVTVVEDVGAEITLTCLRRVAGLYGISQSATSRLRRRSWRGQTRTWSCA